MVKDTLEELVHRTDSTPKPRIRNGREEHLVGHVLDRRRRKGKVWVPEDKKAIAEVPDSYKKELRDLGKRLHQATIGIAPDPLGVARREQEQISKAANWAGYHSRPACTSSTIPCPPCTVWNA